MIRKYDRIMIGKNCEFFETTKKLKYELCYTNSQNKIFMKDLLKYCAR